VHGGPVAGREYRPDHGSPGLQVQAPADDHVVDVCLAKRGPTSATPVPPRNSIPGTFKLLPNGLQHVCPDPKKQERLCHAPALLTPAHLHQYSIDSLRRAARRRAGAFGAAVIVSRIMDSRQARRADLRVRSW
jgi:hypothetical protein